MRKSLSVSILLRSGQESSQLLDGVRGPYGLEKCLEGIGLGDFANFIHQRGIRCTELVGEVALDGFHQSQQPAFFPADSLHAGNVWHTLRLLIFLTSRQNESSSCFDRFMIQSMNLNSLRTLSAS